MKRVILFLTIGVMFLIGTADAASIFGSGGLGIPRTYSGTRYAALAEAGLALSDSIYINLDNPASFASVGLTRFTMSAFISKTTADDPNTSDKQDDLGFEGAAFALPIYKQYGLGFQYQPMTDHNFLFNSRGWYETDEPIQDQTAFLYTDRFQGEGGISRISLTGAATYGPVSIGISGQYIFGMTELLSKRSFESDALLASGQYRSNELSGYSAKIGVTASARRNLQFAAVAQLPAKISNTTVTEFEGGDSSQVEGKDVELPMGIQIGAAWRVGKSTFAADAGMEFWEDTNTDWQPSMKPNNVVSAQLGYEFRPTHLILVDWYKKLTYRAGISYNENYYLVQDEVVNSIRASVGFGIPVRMARGMLDFAVYTDMRGYNTSFNTRETVWGLQMGWSATEAWFQKRKRR